MESSQRSWRHLLSLVGKELSAWAYTRNPHAVSVFFLLLKPFDINRRCTGAVLPAPSVPRSVVKSTGLSQCPRMWWVWNYWNRLLQCWPYQLPWIPCRSARNCPVTVSRLQQWTLFQWGSKVSTNWSNTWSETCMLLCFHVHITWKLTCFSVNVYMKAQ